MNCRSIAKWNLDTGWKDKITAHNFMEFAQECWMPNFEVKRIRLRQKRNRIFVCSQTKSKSLWTYPPRTIWIQSRWILVFFRYFVCFFELYLSSLLVLTLLAFLYGVRDDEMPKPFIILFSRLYIFLVGAFLYIFLVWASLYVYHDIHSVIARWSFNKKCYYNGKKCSNRIGLWRLKILIRNLAIINI